MSEPAFFETSGLDPTSQTAMVLPVQKDLASAEPSVAMVDHITELRRRILVSVGTLLTALAVAFYYSLPLIRMFQAMAPRGLVFVQLTPGEVLMASLRLSFYAAFALSAPVLLYNVLRFVMPGLTQKERPMVLWAVVGGTALFVLGVLFAYMFVVPTALQFLFDYGQAVAVTQVGIESYIAFCSALLVMTGAMFELPMVLFLLSFTGLITSAKLIAEWRWATVMIFLVSAVVTPTQDPFSMTMVGLAMVLLYGFSIIPIKLCGR